MGEKLAKVNQSVEKTLQIIEVLAAGRQPMRLQDVAAACGLPPSTALRLLNTLQQHGYANQDAATLRYGLSLKFAQIGAAVGAQLDIRNLARPLLLELAARCGESCCLAIEENQQVLYVDVVDGPDGMLKIMQRIGKRAPLHCTGVGKLFLLNYDAQALAQYIGSQGLPGLTANTITQPEKLQEELQKVARQGFALDDEECELGARCVAAPVRDYTGRVVAAFSTSGPLHRMTHQHIRTITQVVCQTGARLSQMLAYQV